MPVQPRVVVITGAAGALGQAVANRFRHEGSSLALLDTNAQGLSAIYGSQTRQQLAICVDLLDSHGLDRAVSEIEGQFGGVDVLCNIAGGFSMGPLVHETSDDVWTRMVAINVRTVIATARVFVPKMLTAGTGKIINVAAGSALSGRSRMGAYCAAKAGVLRLTESMSNELKAKNINVNCVLPSIIDAPQNRDSMPDSDPTQWVAPEALADVIAFLASDGARAIHGAAIPVSGLS